VTALFAEVMESGDVAEAVETETLRGMRDRFLTILAEGVHRFDGIVQELTANGMIALFGAPISHEDHARRACHAALHLSAELRKYSDELRLSKGLNFSLRMGLNSGDIVIAKIDDDLRMQYTDRQTVSLAARMLEIAAPERACLTEHTATLTAGRFRLRDLGALSLRGGDQSIKVYELEGTGAVRSRFASGQARNLSPLIGRDEEAAVFDRALARAVSGRGQVVEVTGDAGVGKSRLCYELTQRARARGIRVYEGHCVPYGNAMPFLPILELLRDFFGVAGDDSDDDARRKIAGTVLLTDPALTDVIPLLLDFMRVADPALPLGQIDSAARQRQLSNALQRLIHARSRRVPLIVLIDDLHWIDAGSESFLDDLRVTIPDIRALLLVGYRPEYRPPWSDRTPRERLALRSLGPQPAARLLRELLGDDSSVWDLAAKIRERAGGTPFFMEEMVQTLAADQSLEGERGAYRMRGHVNQITIPPTLWTLLTARMDRLKEPEKAVLQAAAAIGKSFRETVLRRVTDLPSDELGAVLAALAATGLIFEECAQGDAVYSFKHPLMQEVAYSAQSAERRARTHRAVTEAIGELHARHLEPEAALLAHHWEGAGEILEAARWSRRAAEWVGTSHAVQAMAHWLKTRSLLRSLTDSAEAVALDVVACTEMLRLGWRTGLSEDEAATLFAEGSALTTRSGDRRTTAVLLASYATFKGMYGDIGESLARNAEAVDIAEQTGDPALQTALRASLAFAHYAAGDLPRALAIIERAVAEAPADSRAGADVLGFSPLVFLGAFRGLVLTDMGGLADARRHFETSVEQARDLGEKELLAWAHAWYAVLGARLGDADTASAQASAALTLSEGAGSPLSLAQAYNVVGLACLTRGESDEAATAFERSLAIVRDRRAHRWFEGALLASLAEALLAGGDLERARACAEDAVRVAWRYQTRALECVAQLVLGQVFLRLDDAPGATRALRESLSLVEQTGARSLEPFIRAALSDVARLAGDQVSSEREWGEAERVCAEIGATDLLIHLAHRSARTGRAK